VYPENNNVRLIFCGMRLFIALTSTWTSLGGCFRHFTRF